MCVDAEGLARGTAPREWDELLVHGNKVTAQVAMTATRTGGPFRGHKATGNKLRWFSCSVYVVDDAGETILAEHYCYDSAFLEAQLTSRA